MSRGRHAAPRARGPVTQAARTALFRTGAFGGALVLSWAGVSAVTGFGGPDAFAVDEAQGAELHDPLTEKIERLNEKYDCSTTGLAEGVVPARTVVRIDGEVRTATFDEGWAIHLGDVPGTLVSVCAR